MYLCLSITIERKRSNINDHVFSFNILIARISLSFGSIITQRDSDLELDFIVDLRIINSRISLFFRYLFDSCFESNPIWYVTYFN